MSMASENQVRYDVTRLSDDDLYLFNEGAICSYTRNLVRIP